MVAHVPQDVTTHLMNHLSLHPTLRNCSSDTSPGVVVIGDLIVGIENSDGNTNVRFHQKDTLKRFFEKFEQNGITINRFRADCGSCVRSIMTSLLLEAGKLRKSMALSSN